MKRMALLISALSILLSVTACGGADRSTWQEKYDLGVRYLSEGNYALVRFLLFEGG